MNLRELEASLRLAAQWIKWERDSLEDFHAYAQYFKCPPGANVFDFVLQDALRHRGLTLDQLHARQQPAGPQGGAEA